MARVDTQREYVILPCPWVSKEGPGSDALPNVKSSITSIDLGICFPEVVDGAHQDLKSI